MKLIVLVVIAAAGSLACSSTADSEESCQVAGTYSLTQKIDPSADNSCGATDDDAAKTVTVAADGTVTLQGVGGTCPGTISACKLTAACEGSGATGGTVTVQLSWAFTVSGFTGSSALGAQQPGKPKCYATWNDTGVRK